MKMDGIWIIIKGLILWFQLAVISKSSSLSIFTHGCFCQQIKWQRPSLYLYRRQRFLQRENRFNEVHLMTLWPLNFLHWWLHPLNICRLSNVLHRVPYELYFSVTSYWWMLTMLKHEESKPTRRCGQITQLDCRWPIIYFSSWIGQAFLTQHNNNIIHSDVITVDNQKLAITFYREALWVYNMLLPVFRYAEWQMIRNSIE